MFTAQPHDPTKRTKAHLQPVDELLLCLKLLLRFHIDLCAAQKEERAQKGERVETVSE
jgi:hypothetical protein